MKKIKLISLALGLLILPTLASCDKENADEPNMPNEPEQPIDSITPESPNDTIIPNIDEYGICIDKEVDLGLSVIWGGYNIGALSPEENGDYLAWGEVYAKNEYSWNNYKHINPETYRIEFIGESISGTQYDVATFRWKEGWRIPTVEEFNELLNNCEWIGMVYKNGENGYKIKGPNGNCIFLPTTGYKDSPNRAHYGYYWTATFDKEYDTEAEGIHFSYFPSVNLGESRIMGVVSYERYNGFTIRAVKNK